MTMYRVTLLCLLLLVALPLTACDLFNGDDDTATEPVLAARVIVMEGVNIQANAQGNAEFLGQVLSNGTATARNVKVSVSLFNSSGALIDVATANVVPSDLAPQQTGDFKITTSTPVGGYANYSFTPEWDG